ncbi:MAG: nuclear transport factor 2 family protein [Actinomycetota bacterium]|nr:nuclear transport factor 2 family protein [Actinomycetota bacterium]
MPRSLIALACVAALLGAAGCGESDQEQAREVVQAYVDAQNEQDFDAICDLYADSLKQELAVGDCPAFVQEQTTGADVPQELELIEVRVRDETATADIDTLREDGQGPLRLTLTLKREDDDWRISALQ